MTWRGELLIYSVLVHIEEGLLTASGRMACIQNFHSEVIESSELYADLTLWKRDG